MKHLFFIVCCFFSLPVSADNNTQPQIIYVPVPVPVSQNQMQPAAQPTPQHGEPNLFPHIMSIVGNFGKVLLDRHNTANIPAHVAKMIDSIIAVAQEVTRRGTLSDTQKKRIIQLLAQQLQEWCTLNNTLI